jgi:hypothetical protein
MYKKIFIFIFSLIGLFILSNHCFADQFDFVYDIDWPANNWEPIINESLNWNTDFGEIIKTNVVENNDSDLNELIGTFHNNSEVLTNENKATSYVKIIINYFLALIGLVALIVLIYGFYMMFTSSHEEWIKKAKKYVVWAAIAMFTIWVSRFIISWFMFIFLQAS